MKWIVMIGLLVLPLMTQAALFGFNAEDGSSATMSNAVTITFGSDFSTQSDVAALGGEYIDWLNGGGVAPGSTNRVTTYEIPFAEDGTYDLYMRIYVGPVDGGDDSLYIGNGFGIKDPAGTQDDSSPGSGGAASNGDWILVNNILAVAGESAEQYFWVNFSSWSGSYTESGVAFEVLSAGTETLQIGAREDGLRLDAIAFATSGDIYTTADLDAAVAGEDIPDATFVSSPANGDASVSIDSEIVVTATDYGVDYGLLVDHAEMSINDGIVSPVVVNTSGSNTTFTYTPPSDLEYDTEYAVQLQIYRTDTVVDTVDFTFTTIADYRLRVLYSGVNQGRSQPMLDFLSANYPDVLFTYGDYSDFATHSNEIAAADLLIIGRKISSTPFANAANTAQFNALTNPVVCFTSYASRPDGGRWGWHDGSATGGWSITNAETTVTAAGSELFGVAAGSTNDWFTNTAANNFYATGSGEIGGGEILATLGGDILVAHWSAGDMFGSGIDSAGGERLLFNLPEISSSSSVIIPDTDAGQQALLDALNAFTPLGNGGGSGPVDPAVPVIASFLAGAGNISLSWSSETGVNYHIQSTSDLESGNWSTEITVPGNGSTISTNLSMGEDGTEFIRLEAVGQ